MRLMIEQGRKLVNRAGGKALCVCLCLSVLANVFLAGYGMAYEPECERWHMEDIDRESDWVQNEELAKSFAGASIGLEDGWEEQDDFHYAVECTYNEGRYEWIVLFIPVDANGGSKRIVGIRRDLGLITIYQ